MCEKMPKVKASEPVTIDSDSYVNGDLAVKIEGDSKNKKVKKESKSLKRSLEGEDGPTNSKSKPKVKKAKLVGEADAEAETSNTVLKSKKAAAATHTEDADRGDAANDKPEAIIKTKSDNKPIELFNLSPQTVQSLLARGIKELFPIQALTYSHLRAGKDLIGRARTGQGKTLAFCLPIIERLLESNKRLLPCKPFVVCLTPTRELAKQIVGEVESVATSLKVCAVYGGTSINDQRSVLRGGVHIIVGTPGRVLDLLERKALDLSSVHARILDEADQMLDMGFQDDVDKIFEAMKSVGPSSGGPQVFQTVLFSATLPPWVKTVTQKYMINDKITVDLVENQDEKAAVSVRHVAIPCHWTSLATTISDVVAVYAGSTNRTIVFCETKKECNELCLDEGIQFDCQALHGDIPQSQREKTLQAFKDGKFQVLLATDVAARGLDMTVDLVVNSKPPVRMSGKPDTETYVHRSGRTGRAGRSGVCVTLYTPKFKTALKEIERVVGNEFEWRGAPQPSEITGASAALAFDSIRDVGEDATAPFAEQAKQLIKSLGAERAVAAALAVITGHTKPLRQRSLLSNSDGYVTFQFHSPTSVFSPTFVFNDLRVAMGVDEQVMSSIRGMTLTADGKGAVFDVPEEHKAHLEEVMASMSSSRSSLSFPTSIPPLKDNFSSSSPARGRAPARGRRGGGFGRSRGRGFGRF